MGVARQAIPGDGRDDAAAIAPSDPPIAVVGDEEIATTPDRDILGLGQSGARRQSSIAGKRPRARRDRTRARDRGKDAPAVDAVYPVVIRIGDEERAVR